MAAIRKEIGSRQKVTIFVALLFVVLAGVIYGLQYKSATSTKAATACDTDAVGAAISKDPSLLNTATSSKLKPLTAQILKIPNYQKSQTCLYALTYYYAHAADAKQARLYYDQLNKISGGKPHYSKAVSNGALSMAALKSLVEYVEKRSSQIYKNGRMLPAI